MQKLGPNEFEGTYGELEKRRRRDGAATIKWSSRVITPDTKLYVDGAGTIYAPADSSGRLTVVVGFCTGGKK